MAEKRCAYCGEYFFNRSGTTRYCNKHLKISKFEARAANAKRRASRLGLTEHYSGLELYRLVESFGLRCARCGQSQDWGYMGWVADHVVSLSQGGTNTIDNIQILCFACNGYKHSKTIDYR